MARRIVKRVQAKRDITSHFLYFAEIDLDIAERFRTAVDRTFGLLIRFPKIDARRISANARLNELRMWQIADFPDYLIFYQPEDNVIRIVRVLHASQDQSRRF